MFGASTGNFGFGGAPTGFQTPTQPQTGGFGFGAGQQPTSLFGTQPQAAAPSTGFGASTFGQQPATGFGAGGFGSTPSSTFGTTSMATSFANPTNPSPFGATTPSQPSSLFGAQPAQSSPFGGTQTSLFGAQPAAQPATGGLFGQPATQPAAGGFFGQPATTTFGAATPQQPAGGFGATNFGMSSSLGSGGTAAAKYSPSAVQEGNTSIQLFSISAQHPYQQKSAEELRWEDYQANRKGVPGGSGAATTGGFGTTSSPFGGATTGGFGPTTGGFGAPAATGGFGTTQPATTTFGAPNTGGFGATQPSTTPSFGGFGATGGFGSTFGNTPTTQPAQSTGFGFGAAAQPAQTSTFGGFGAKPATAATTPSFGGFGQPQQQPAATTSTFGGFGATQPAASTPGAFSFGSTNPSQPSAFGAGGLSTSTQTPGFGATQPGQTTGGFGFGSTAATTSPSSGFSFGATTPAKPAQPSFSFGTNTPATTTLGAGQPAATTTPSFGGFGTGFGAQPSATTGFGSSTFSFNTTPASTLQKPSTGFGASTLGGTGFGNFGAGGLGASTFQTATAQPVQPTLLTSIEANPFGIPGFTTAPTDTRSDLGDSGIQSVPLNDEKDKKKVIPLPHFKTTPRSAAKIKPRNAGKSPSAAHMDGLGATTESLNKDMFHPRRSVKKLEITNEEDFADSKTPLTKTPLFRDSIDEPSYQSPEVAKTTLDYFADDSPSRKPNSTRIHPSELQTKHIPTDSLSSKNQNNLSLSNPSYYTSPPIERLQAMTPSELQNVRNFEIGCPQGSLLFDIADLSKEGDLCKTVIFGDKNVSVYPDDSVKPPLGQGLNRPATVRLTNCFTIDKKTKEPIKDEQDPQVLKKIMRFKSIKDTTFVSYVPASGTWTFKVQHFSRYGLDDDDDEDDDVVLPPAPQNPQASQPSFFAKEAPFRRVDTDLTPKRAIFNAPIDDSEDEDGFSGQNFNDEIDEMAGEDFDQDLEGDLGNGTHGRQDVDAMEGVSYGQGFVPSKPRLAEQLGLEAEKVQRMRASFFGSSSSRPNAPRGIADQPTFHFPWHPEATAAQQPKPPKEQPPTIAFAPFQEVPEISEAEIEARFAQWKKAHQDSLAAEFKQKRTFHTDINEKLNPTQSCMFSKEKSTDPAIMLGRSFRVGWGPGGQLLHLGNPLNKSQEVRGVILKSTVVVESVDFLTLLPVAPGRGAFDAQRSLQKKHIEDTLDLALENAMIPDNPRIDPCVPRPPLFQKFAGLADRQVHSLRDYVDVTEELRGFAETERKIWHLTVALWDPIAFQREIDDSDRRKAYIEMLDRRTLVENWIRDFTTEITQRDAQDGNPASAIFYLLANGRFEDASRLALSAKDFRLATLIAQCPVDNSTRQLFIEQVVSWDKHFPKLIPEGYLRIYRALSGQIDKVSSGLDWIRAFGLHLWYGTEASDPLSTALGRFVSHWQDGNEPSLIPRPSYSRSLTRDREGPLDVCYNLLGLYASDDSTLASAIQPRSITSAPFDSRLTWHLFNSLGAKHIRKFDKPLTSERLHVAFAEQLEILGLWKWAVFVLLHLSDPVCRENSIRELLSRSLVHTGSLSQIDQEFLADRLNIPPSWIHHAKAAHAEMRGRYRAAVDDYLLAGSLENAHRVLLEHLAADLIIKENYQALSEVLMRMEPEMEEREDWKLGGKIYKDYVEVTLEFPIALQLVANGSDDGHHRLLALKAMMQSLTKGFTKMRQYDSLQFRVAFEEMAAKISQRLQLIQGKSQLAEEYEFSITRLPLTEDQRLMRIHNLSNNFLNTLLSA